MATLKKEHIHHFKGGLTVFLNKNPLQNASPSNKLKNRKGRLKMSNKLLTTFNKHLVDLAKLSIKTYFATSAVAGLVVGYVTPSAAKQDMDTLTFKRPTGFLDYSATIFFIPFTSTGALIRSVVDNNSTPPSPTP